MSDKEAAEVVLLPEGRVINHSVFVMDQYNEQAKPAYKIELAFERGALDAFFDKLLDWAVDTWGDGADSEEAGVIVPILDGDRLAEKREARGKPGDAYKGMDVIRANTIFNKHGEEGPGGVQVIAPDGESEIGPANKEEFYQGCYAIAAVTINGYVKEGTGNDPDRNAMTLYLAAVQKTRDGERLVTPKDHSNLFKPVGRKAPAEGEAKASGGGGGRRRRAG